ncbi:ketosteroid isomerase-like protein [Streptosporangium lutulentum]|uniref:Ketosteroid isomerase-like protein n=2 Tax=Streptosporangium lutulentum TaxID=1461250 RepID=A0ABT9QSD4_9ACTN|nr:ester cyclase [Streptosporangium lutulentum]MDP9849335.1 ketosteroid isomerase-like protein [Streptosporangium lutulentum]
MLEQDQFGGLVVFDDQEVADGLIAAFNAHDSEAATRFFGPRASYVCPGGVAEGREEIASYFDLYFEGLPDIRVVPHDKVACGDLVVCEWIITGTHTGPFLLPSGGIIQATGRRIAVRGCDVRTMDNGAIASQRVYYDQLEMLNQFNILCMPE